MSRLNALFCLTILLASTACTSLPRMQPAGPEQVFTFNERAPEGVSTPLVALDLPAGKVELRGHGETDLLAGTLRYNHDALKPTLTHDAHGIRLSQNNPSTPDLFTTLAVTNAWDVTLGTMPLSLSLEAGALDGTLDLSGVALTHAEFSIGAGNPTLKFTEANPAALDELTFTNGAGNVSFLGLGYANAKRVRVDSGAGNYTLDFAGALQQDLHVIMKSGTGNVTLLFPADANVEAYITGGMQNVDTTGTWSQSSDEHYSATGTSAYRITLDFDGGLGNVTLKR